ncbi:MAG: FtsX-like permease family protein [Gammaproteobacteria bacterium]|nr:FtsX-like permease family protein [Gammaproteobacteria bacterium]
MSTLRRASLRHLWQHPGQLALALAGLALGVATIVAIDIATASARRAFELSLAAVNGAATHQIEAGPPGIDPALYVALRRTPLADADPPPPYQPLLSAYATIGERTLQLIGTDPLAAAELGGAAGSAALGNPEQVRDWFTRAGAVVLGADTARELNLAPGADFELEVAGRPVRAHLLAVLDPAQAPGLEDLLLTDIAQAQEWLQLSGRLSRIDARLGGPAAVAALRDLLPPGTRLEPTRAAARESFALTGAFTTNLQAMSLLGLLVGVFLIYGAVSFAVLQRRPLFGVLRALGTTRAELLRLVLGEALLLGVLGALAGVALGVLIGRELLQLVTRTINDLYFVLAVREVTVPTPTLAKGFAAALLCALTAALVPALEVAGCAPRLPLSRSVLEARATRLARRLAGLAVLLLLAAGLTILGSGRSLFGGFAALFLLLLAVAALAPAALQALARASARLTRSARLRLALADIGASLSRTGVAVAALGMALAAMIGVAVMVESFRVSLREWLAETLRADIYVSAPGPAASLGRRLEPQVIAAILATPGLRAHSEARRAHVDSAYGELEVNALRLVPGSAGAFRLLQGEPRQAWPAFDRGAILISEPLAWRLNLHPGATLPLVTAEGLRGFPVAGVYREYGNERGELLMDLDTYRRHWHDEALGALGLYLQPGVDVPATVVALQRAARGRQALFIRSNAQLRELSLQIFERTFLITRVLYWLAAGVAALGLLSALLAWQLARARELALLRTLGLTPLGSAALILTQTLFMGLAAFLAALPAGLLTALVLTAVINRRAFGWQIGLHLHAAQFLQALLLALVTAAVAALYPSWRASRVGLAGALREE